VLYRRGEMGKTSRKVKRAKEEGVYRTTTTGVTVRCLPIATMMERQEASIRGSVEWPEVPTRIITDVAGAEGVEALSEDYIAKDKRATDEQKEQWAEYQAEQVRAEGEYQAKMTVGLIRLIATRGIRLPEGIEEEWLADDEFLLIDTPEDEKERLVHWFQGRVLGDPTKDLAEIIAGCHEASGYDKEVLSRLEASFREPVGGAKRDTSGDGAGDTGAEKAKERVVVRKKVASAPSAEVVGESAG
jgi:hypothetical protein